MQNRNYDSFERNHYFYGKLLTSRDFQSEQRYFNDKRRFLNRVLYGSGVICGLNVVAADDMSLILQSGAALDAGGREIVVPETQVMKLSTIPGYQELKTDYAYLGIRYRESFSDPVYAVMDAPEHGGDAKEYNHIREGYELFLIDGKDWVKVEHREDELFHHTVLYQDSDISLTWVIPSCVVPGSRMKTKFVIRKLSHVPFAWSVKGVLQGENFVQEEQEIRGDNISLEYGETKELICELTPQDYVFGGQELTVKVKDLEIWKAGAKERIKQEASVKVAPLKESLLDYIKKNSGRGPMDVELERTYDEKILLAGIRLLRSGSSALIDAVETDSCVRYVCHTEDLMMLHELQEYLEPEQKFAGAAPDAAREAAGAEAQKAGQSRTQTSGVFELSLGNGGEAGKTYLSDEIMHGLGNGPVYVELGIEYLVKRGNRKDAQEEILLGDSSIFEQEEGEEKLYRVDTAIRILPDRGTFIAGIRPRVKTGKISLRIRWFAWKPEDLEQRVYRNKEQGGCLMIRPDTMILPPKGSVHINPVFVNMPEEALTYTVLEPEGGQVENNGVYTAPAQEGVYEVRVSCVNNANIYAHAFMIVSQKKADERQTEN